MEEGITPTTEGGVESAPPAPVDEAIIPTSTGGEESAPPPVEEEVIGKTSAGGEQAGPPEIQLEIADLPGKDVSYFRMTVWINEPVCPKMVRKCCHLCADIMIGKILLRVATGTGSMTF